METRNHKLTGSAVVCEVNHPNLGWIEYTATADDTEPFGQEVWAAVSGLNITESAAPTILDVNQECERRIFKFIGVDDKLGALAKQQSYSHILQSYAVQVESGMALTAEQAARKAAIVAGYQYIQAVVDTSNEITAMEPIPVDFEDDKYWPKEAK